MAKFNSGATRAVGAGPVKTEQTASGVTHEGGPGFGRDPLSELYVLGITNFVSEPTFYESASERDGRFAHLVRQVAVSDFDWLVGFAHWLRTGDAHVA